MALLAFLFFLKIFKKIKNILRFSLLFFYNACICFWENVATILQLFFPQPNTITMNNKYTIIIFVLCTMVLFSSCDEVKDDVAPIIETKTEYFTRPNTPFVVNMVNRHILSQNSTLRLKNAPAKGRAEFAGRTFLIYMPNANVSNIADNINYELCTDGTCTAYTLNVQIGNNTPNAQDSLNACQQISLSSIGTLNLAQVPSNTAPIYMDVTQNGYNCTSYNLSSLEIVAQPARGIVQVEQISGTNFYNIKYTYNANSNSQANPDIFVFKIILSNNSVAYGVGVVDILDNPNCALLANFDGYNNVLQNQIFVASILQNDQYCAGYLQSDTLQALQIITPPINGQVVSRSLAGKYIYYRSNAGFSGIDSLKYQLKYANGTISQAWVTFNVL